MTDLREGLATAVLADRVEVRRVRMSGILSQRVGAGWLVTDGHQVGLWLDSGPGPLWEWPLTHLSRVDVTLVGTGLVLTAGAARWRIMLEPPSAGSAARDRGLTLPSPASELVDRVSGSSIVGSRPRLFLWKRILTRRLVRSEGSTSSRPPRRLDLAMTRKELYARAQDLQIPGRSTMTKTQLVAAILARSAPKPPTERPLSDLRDAARRLGIAGRSRMTRAQLEEAIELVENAADVWDSIDEIAGGEEGDHGGEGSADEAGSWVDHGDAAGSWDDLGDVGSTDSGEDYGDWD